MEIPELNFTVKSDADDDVGEGAVSAYNQVIPEKLNEILEDLSIEIAQGKFSNYYTNVTLI